MTEDQRDIEKGNRKGRKSETQRDRMKEREGEGKGVKVCVRE